MCARKRDNSCEILRMASEVMVVLRVGRLSGMATQVVVVDQNEKALSWDVVCDTLTSSRWQIRHGSVTLLEKEAYWSRYVQRRESQFLREASNLNVVLVR